MTLLASVASLFCSFSVSAAAPTVAVVPTESVNRVEIISPIFQSDAALDSESLTAADPADTGEVADVLAEATDFTPDKLAADSNDELLLPADVVIDDEALLPADVIVDAEEILPADVIADIDADSDVVSKVEAEGIALAEAAATTAPLFDEDPAEELAPTPAPAEEPAGKGDPGDASGDGEAAS
ncbi:MAG TPA: hypothetical protein VGP94_09975 [Tepidisphaeraceae bacterium]|nr:hypothetical protein [Tepidisphaeraceae bacterium]